jgi:hypothetical protein
MTDDDLRPAAPRREDPAEPEAAAAAPPDDEALALERGRTAAMVAALGRVQMSLDILTRKVASLEATVRELRRP